MHTRVSYVLSVFAASLISTATLLFIFSGLQYQSTLSGLVSAIRYSDTGSITKDIAPSMQFRSYQYGQIYWSGTELAARRGRLTIFGSSMYRNIWALILQSPVDKIAALIGIAAFANALAITAGSYIARWIFHKIDVFIVWDEVPKQRSILVNRFIRRLALFVAVPASVVASFITWRLTTGIHFGGSLFALDPVLLSAEDVAVYFCAMISFDIFLVSVLMLFLRSRFFSAIALNKFRRCGACGYHVGRLQPCPECGTTRRQWSRRNLFLLARYFSGFSLLGFALTVIAALSMAFVVFYDNTDSLKNNFFYAQQFLTWRPIEKNSSEVRISLNYSKVIEIENDTHRAIILALPHSEIASRPSWDSKVYAEYVWAYLRQPLSADPGNNEQWDISVFSSSTLNKEYAILDDLSIMPTIEYFKINNTASSVLMNLMPSAVMSTPPLQYPLGIQPDSLCFINQSRDGVWNPELVSEVRARLRQATTDR